MQRYFQAGHAESEINRDQKDREFADIVLYRTLSKNPLKAWISELK